MNVHRFNANHNGRDFVVGDLHGQLQSLHDAMDRVGFDRSCDRLFGVGDMIDRGVHSQACLELVKESWFHAVLGNHEEMMCSYFETRSHPELALWQQNGGSAWADSDFRNGSKFIEMVELAYSLPLAIEVELRDGKKIGITHAEPPCRDWNQVDDQLQIQWYRHKAL